MKTTIIAIIGLAFIGTASATTVASSAGTLGAQFRTSTGVVLTSTNSSFTVGTISGDIYSQFALTNGTNSLAISTVPIAAFAGKLVGEASDISVDATGFDGSQIWFEVAYNDGVNSGVAYLSSGDVFPTNNNGVGDGIQIDTNALTTFDASLSTVGTVAAGGGEIIVGVIPEPSVALLGALGILGLLRRRR